MPRTSPGSLPPVRDTRQHGKRKRKRRRRVDQASETLVIGAGKASVMKVIADFESYPQWVDIVKQTEIVATDSRRWVSTTLTVPSSSLET